RCLDSVLNQTYRKTEIFLVDDGSEDSSYRICLDYAAKDPRIFVIRKPQSGVSDSRNQAMDRAKGKYLQFVDSDDWIAADASKIMVEAAEVTESDLVVTHFYRVKNHKMQMKGHIEPFEVLSRREFAEHMMEKPANFYYGVMWNKLYRRDIMNKYQIRCSKDINWCEDFLLNLEYLCYAEKVVAVPFPTYYYVKTKNSLVSKETTVKNMIQMKLFTFSYYKALYEQIDLYEENKVKVNRYLLAVAEDGR
ncbi:MAG: glycosyltransferase family 2 protein, partial [Hungatella sp.]